MGEINLVLPGTTPTNSYGSTSGSEVAATRPTTESQLHRLTEAEQKKVSDFAQKINLHDSAVIASYGEAAQRKLSALTDNALKDVTGRDTGGVGDLLAEMSVNIKDFNNDTIDSKKPSFLRSTKKKLETLRVKYDSVTDSLDRIAKELEAQRQNLLVDINMLDDMYDQNLDYFKELTMYIMAGRLKLEETRSGELEDLRKKAEMSGAQEDAFLYNDLRNLCENFDKQLYDLELTRTICLQSAPQIRLVQDTDSQLVRKIQSSINNSIPVWKQKITISLALEHNRSATKAQKAMTDLTSEMLKENAKLLHMGTVEAAREAERGIVDIDAVLLSNTELIATIDDVLSIQDEGRKARAEAKVELMKAEDDLRQKLIGASQQQKR